MTLSVAEALQRYRRTVILGGPGSGKTTLTRWLAVVFARREQADAQKLGEHFTQPRLPVLLELRRFVDHLAAASAPQWIRRWMYTTDSETLLSIPYQGRLVGPGLLPRWQLTPRLAWLLQRELALAYVDEESLLLRVLAGLGGLIGIGAGVAQIVGRVLRNPYDAG